MQASTSPSEASGGYATRRGHVPQLSISDPSHHVTEAIGHMYEDDYDRRESKRLSYISSPLSEAITTIHPSLAGAEAPTSPQSLQVQNHLNEINQHRQGNGQSRPPLVTKQSFDRDSNPSSPGSTDTANTSFPLNDIDYESDPAAVAQELNNLAAIRRMSMDVAAAGDPDLPSLPSIAPSPSDDENDASRLFWVPARLHPELAPKEFKSFLDSKADHIKRKSGDFSLSPNGSNSGGLQRKRSMLSRQIDNSHGYTDGAERLERKRSKSKRDSLSPNLQDLETIVDNSKTPNKDTASLLKGVQSLGLNTDEDRPILPPAPLGNSLRRSTRTQYRKAGSVKKGDKYPRRVKSPETNEPIPSIVTSAPDSPILGLTRVSTDPTPSATKRGQATTATHGTTDSSSATGGSIDSTIDQPKQEGDRPTEPHTADSANRASAPPQARQWHSRISSNGRSTANIPNDQKVPEIVEPSSETNRAPSSSASQQNNLPDREHSYDSSTHSPSKGSPLNEQNVSKRSHHTRHKDSTFNEFANTVQPLPGNTTRTDSLSFIPTLPEDRKSESKKSKDKKDSDGTRKSSWHWLLGSEEKEKEKEKKKEKDGDSKKIKARLVDKVHETTSSLPSSSDNNQRGRESFAHDRLDPKLEEERRKDNARRTSGESKKEKESGLFSSIFGGGRKKHSSGESHHKKSLSRTLSPDPPVRILRPDVDYPWTRFSILEERAIYRMAHIKLANPRRALCSQVLLSNFMYSYLAKVQQMHPHMMLASSAAQRQQQKAREREQEEYMQQYQRYQEAQEQQYGDGSYDDSHMYEYNDDPHDPYRTHSGGNKHGYENGNSYGPGHYQYGHSAFGDDAQQDDDDDDDMW
ncbi:hypothetical protein ASPWEDRAFT_32629 [Aspergillus wentii DTO 134E9]|uniref:Protein Zds1 C-terminal domain-containing protein n=1 Tax=Aspergillus wentii DTO 134E9 TaxID=1073089 RepID=A0A1L9R6E1_ASPWE|nr:uncharacterized protein ASPWEDRAFT_32629 [Aspergillus wentii DTO 134E9]OJJ30453.1 hypothetical protein ASPWEDRAFT_32629 [Aspergillus wentii DTO 134E9]